MTLDSTILIGAITTLAGCVAYLWRQITATTEDQTEDLRQRLVDRSEELNACLVRERGLLAKLAESKGDDDG